MIHLLPQVSFVISTFNRRADLLATLGHVYKCRLPPNTFDIYVIDNASTDGTSTAVRRAYPNVKLSTLRTNNGAVAKNVALPKALGKFIVFLDDDAFPAPGALRKMIRHFDADPRLGAAAFSVVLPDGHEECSAYPNVFTGCGVGFRRKALREVGGLPDDFFMQAEEYDLSLRLLDAGWKVERFSDLIVNHAKSPRSRVSGRTMRLDVRNNLFVILRRFPLRRVGSFGRDWMTRYFWIAQKKGLVSPFLHGLIEGVLRSLVRPQRAAVSTMTFDAFVKTADIQKRLHESLDQQNTKPKPPSATAAVQEKGSSVVAPSRPNRVLLVDVGKNIRAYFDACVQENLQIVAVVDDQLAAPGRRYHGVPVVTQKQALALRFDLVIVSNSSPVHAAQKCCYWRSIQPRPVLDPLAPTATDPASVRDTPARSTDNGAEKTEWHAARAA